MKTATLHTLGYSGFTPETFAAKLQAAGVEVLVDVRRKPISRKKGFSSKGLAAFLSDRKIEYRHLPELGMPETLLSERHEGMDVGEYLAAFGRYLNGCDETLDELLRQCEEQHCCLMCLEKNPRECHRSVIAAELQARSNGKLVVQHLSASGESASELEFD